MARRPPTLAALRRHAFRATLAAPATLARAMVGLGFVQADPIRAPARAQDLILRHRVQGYRAGDLERRFARLGLEEDFLYAYGFMPAETRRLVHPREDPEGPEGRHEPAGLAAEVLAHVRERGPTHPTELEERFGREQAVNGWGGLSKATTRALERLHFYGYLRVARRTQGIRVYEAVPPPADEIDLPERARRLVLLAAGILAPLPEASLGQTLRLMSRGGTARLLPEMRRAVRALVASGALERAEVDGAAWLWPADSRAASDDRPVRREVRLLAPFDPVVWDRRRFEMLWGWPYRFEAYVPAAKRERGYYALPLAWGDRVIGWATVTAGEHGLDVTTGFVGRAPAGRAFRTAFDAEMARMAAFLGAGG